MEKILTIVIPTYNMQDYLRRCLDSLIVPEEQMKQLEVLVVNDGSKDNSSAIAHEYQDKYPDTFRVIDKENGNYGSCVNKGIVKATGKYFKILDADDWYNTGALEYTLKVLMVIDVDMVITRLRTYYELKNKNVDSLSFDGLKTNFIYNKGEGEFETIDFYRYIGMHKVAYRTTLLKKIGLKLQEGISYTDNEYAYYPFEHINSVIFLNEVLYTYWIGREGQTVTPGVMAKRSWQLYKIIDRMLDKYKANKDKAVHKFQYQYLANTCAMYYHLELMVNEASQERNKQMKNLDNKIKSIDLYLYNQIPKCSQRGSIIKFWRLFPYKFVSLFYSKLKCLN